MSSKKNRKYDGSARQAQALQTREKILEAAKSLLQSNGYESVTIDAIAKEAGVATPTVYAQFQSKRGILKALLDESLPISDFNTLVEQARNAKSASERLKITAKIARNLYDAEKTHIQMYPGATLISPEFKEVEQEREKRRYDRLEETINSISQEGALTPELTITKARDILWTFTGRDIYRMLVIDRRWSSNDYEAWLAEMLIKTIVK